MSSTAPKTRRLFFALWPDASIRAQLRAVVHSDWLGRGRAVSADNLHLTLYFPGVVDAERQACAERVADAVQGTAFTLTVDQLGHFPRPQVVWLGSSQPPAALLQLVADLGRGLQSCGFPSENRPFQAHVTLMRKVARAPRFEPPQPIEWPVSCFALVESQTLPEGVQYQVLRRWPLHPAEGL